MDKKTFKTPKNKALGSSRAQNLEPGDIVTWKTWSYNMENEVFETKEGLLIEIIEENRLENIVLLGKIMVFGASEYDFIPVISLKKSTKQDYL
tara:strand:+ start:1770 stop:2048 length:279 start_codon:yes stop_codon:yes gene_type:complete